MAAAAVSLASVLANLTFSAQNCNSLNVSTSCPKQLKKIAAITGSKCNIIFLSDLRLNNSETVNDLKKTFLGCSSLQYDFYYNSSKNKRGVGILISRDLDFQILDTFSDNAENILGLHVSSGNYSFILASIYGPNTVDLNFFNDIRRCFQMNPDENIIVGGDWNLTFSTADTDFNIDIFRMAAPLSGTG